MYAWYKADDRWTPWHIEGFGFTYSFASKAEVERFAATMHLPINWL